MWASVFWEMPTAGICSHLSTKGWVRSASDVRWRVLAQVLASQFITEALDVDEVRNRNNVSPLCSSKVWKTKSSKKDWRARGTQECRGGHHKPPSLQWTIHQARVSAALTGSSTSPRPTCLRQKHLSVTALLALWPFYTCSHLLRNNYHQAPPSCEMPLKISHQRTRVDVKYRWWSIAAPFRPPVLPSSSSLVVF